MGVRAAAADVAAHALADPGLVEHAAGVRHLVQHPDRRAELAGRAVAALERVVGDERPLERVQLPVPGEALDGHDLGALMRDRQGQAAVRTPAVQEDGAGAALPVVASLLRARDPEPLAQRVEQRGAGVHHEAMFGTVHRSATSASIMAAGQGRSSAEY